MSQQVQELIDKIKTEGIQEADQKATEIKTNAQTDARKIVEGARAQADKIIAEANAEAKKIHESTQMALKQAARDTLLALKKEIKNILERVVSQQVSDALTAEHLASIIGDAIKKSVETKLADDGILIGLNAKDLSRLKDGFIAKLQKETKKSITIQPADDMAKGFTISFDAGKSCFDFSDASLTDYVSTYLNTQIADLIKKAK